MTEKAANEINQSTKSAREFLRKSGFNTEDNKLGKQYRQSATMVVTSFVKSFYR